MEIKVLKSSIRKDFEEWLGILESMPEKDIYFYPQYSNVFEHNGDGESCCFICKDNYENVVIHPFLRRRINDMEIFKDLDRDYYDITSPYGFGGYLKNKPVGIDMNACLELFNNYCVENNIISEFVRFTPWMDIHEECACFMDVSLWNKVVAIDLTKAKSELWADFDSKNRNRIRKSIKCNVIVKENRNFEYLDKFCSLYYQTMNRNNATSYYYFDQAFFKNLIHKLSQNLTFFYAFWGKKIIGAVLVLYCRDFAHVFLACTDEDYLEFAPSNLMFYISALWAKKRKFKYLFLGGGRSPSQEDSLLRFKKRFSKLYFDFYLGKKIYNNKIYDLLSQKNMRANSGRGKAINDNSFFPLYRGI
ncbi:GNAT family N-acetyltransferase [candidate division KSB1 bacterium]|nr:GNAT family N-acetyltransferase [candidate division KSB1 bacterium]